MIIINIKHDNQQQRAIRDNTHEQHTYECIQTVDIVKITDGDLNHRLSPLNIPIYYLSVPFQRTSCSRLLLRKEKESARTCKMPIRLCET